MNRVLVALLRPLDRVRVTPRGAVFTVRFRRRAVTGMTTVVLEAADGCREVVVYAPDAVLYLEVV